MSYLQLADASLNRPVEDYYVRVPTNDGGSLMVREDYFDQYDDGDWNAIMDQLEGFGMNDMGDRAARAQRKANRQAKKASRTANKQSKADARIIRAQTGNTFGNKVGNFITGAIGAFTGNTPGAPPTERDVAINYNPPPPPDDREWYQKPVYIIPLGLAGLAGIYFISKQLKN